MSSITVQTRSPHSGPIRPLNILRDLPQVADLIELCFSSTMDDDGQSYVQQMRRASRDNSFLKWAGQVMDSASLPLSGFVYEENGKIVGNASIVYQTYKGKKLALIANVATHPDYRRRGIGHDLTERAMQQARQKNASELWLHVREDNPTAIKIYTDLGFVERARRTTYESTSQPLLTLTTSGATISNLNPRDWPLQHEWLLRAHPNELSWYYHWNWEMLSPDLWRWLYRLFTEYEVRQWAATQNGKFLAAVTLTSSIRAANMLWVATAPQGDEAGLRSVLEAARHDLAYYRKLVVEHPAGEMAEAIQSAGFRPTRTLIWMSATS